MVAPLELNIGWEAASTPIASPNSKSSSACIVMPTEDAKMPAACHAGSDSDTTGKSAPLDAASSTVPESTCSCSSCVKCRRRVCTDVHTCRLSCNVDAQTTVVPRFIATAGGYISM